MKLWKRCLVACVAVLLCVCTAFALVACKNQNVGVYRYSASIADHYDGVLYDGVLSDDIIAQLEDCSVGANISLEENGTFKFASGLYTPNGKSSADLDEATQTIQITGIEGTYAVDGEKLTLTAEDGSVYEGTIKDGTITIKIYSDVGAVQFVLDD